MLTVLWQTKRTVSFPFEDKHVVNKHHVIRKSHVATQKNSVLRWCISIYHVIGLKETRGIKIFTLKKKKNFVGIYWEE